MDTDGSCLHSWSACDFQLRTLTDIYAHCHCGDTWLLSIDGTLLLSPHGSYVWYLSGHWEGNALSLSLGLALSRLSTWMKTFLSVYRPLAVFPGSHISPWSPSLQPKCILASSPSLSRLYPGSALELDHPLLFPNVS